MTPPASPPDWRPVSARTAYSEKVLTNPSGFIGVDGAFRFRANGINERGLAIYEITHGAAQVIEPAPKNFSKAGT